MKQLSSNLPVVSKTKLSILDEPHDCPFVKVGDFVTVKPGCCSDRVINIGIRDLVYDWNVKGCCEIFPKLTLIQGTNNKFYHPGTDLLGVECRYCPYKELGAECEQPVVWV